ncbi:MAG: hypothetical protein K2Q09_00240 [Phycisphaerales bacterium]|nr:hypothetical protein [Phycisphaerales bacterium]
MRSIGCSLALASVGGGEDDAARRLRAGLALARAGGCGAVQLDGSSGGMRARELDRSARRDVAATLKREGVAFSGVDLWVPERHFAEAAHVDRALRAVVEACGLAGELAKLTDAESRVSVCVTVAKSAAPAAVAAIGGAAMGAGVVVADYGPGERVVEDSIGAGFDPAAELAAGRDPLARLGEMGGTVADARLTDSTRVGRCAVGDGSLDVRAYRAVLETVTAVRWVVVDVRGVSRGAGAVGGAVGAWEGG